MAPDVEARVRRLEVEFASHKAECKQIRMSQKEVNDNVRSKITMLFDRLSQLPTEKDVKAVEAKIDTATEKQQTIINLLERKKGREDIVKIGLTAAITILTSLAVYWLTH